ncbi:hypothetical protein AMTR_s00249p00016800 [Amborella trichopoda]|uniref:Uncharacterized protein n=1 Tax=Amborella trichopoda TaxID=13333 RepID=W1NQ98_AMBTC|nr:hypothetical protein AMTR_s00249p00016800 [Amborella trichopoda]
MQQTSGRDKHKNRKNRNEGEEGCTNTIVTSDEDGGSSGVAPLWVTHALNLEARSPAKSIIEKSCAQSRSFHAIALVKVSIPTSLP